MVVYLTHQNDTAVATLKPTAENNNIVKALKKIAETKWVGNITHDSLDKCLVAINTYSGINSGWYNPVAVKINGLTGIYMVNQSGNLHFESRIIKQDNDKFLIEYLSDSGYNQFESIYREIANN